MDDNTIANLAAELPDYYILYKVTWWAVHCETLPHWSALVKQLLLIHPSSAAAAERVFSLLSSLSSQQESALEDYIETSVMIRYNSSQRKQ